MAKKGIKVRDLAKEVGLTSRQVIDRCRAEGLMIQNSITKIQPHQIELVRKWLAVGAPLLPNENVGDV